MILDNLATTRTAYENMDTRLAKAFDWLRNTDLNALTEKKVHIDGERIFALPQGYETIDASAGDFEVHRNYIDIQYMVKGEEVMYWTPLAELKKPTGPYNYEGDAIHFEDPEFSQPFLVREGDFAVFFPSDGHKARCHNGSPQQIMKIVIKIAV